MPDQPAESSAQKVNLIEKRPVSLTIWQQMGILEDWWAIWIGLFLLGFTWLIVAISFHRADPAAPVNSPLAGWVPRLAAWEIRPWESIYVPGSGEDSAAKDAPRPHNEWPALLRVFLIGLVCFGLGRQAAGVDGRGFLPGYAFLFLVATCAMVLASQVTIKQYNLEYALWALLLGVLINIGFGTPRMVRGALVTEFYIKTGLVLLGAELLLHQLLILGIPGFCTAWVVTPIVFISTYLFGQKILKIESPSLNAVISADMSVCGVSAAIATASACKARKEELSMAIGISLTFTVVMMAILPAVIKSVGMSEVLGGAWIGGTIDSTGAVAAAGGLVGPHALKVATTVKLLQNILIGFVAFGVAVYWVRVVERGEASSGTISGVANDRTSLWVIWERFPKFILGFFAACLMTTFLVFVLPRGSDQVQMVLGFTKPLMTWFFALAFVSIGLEIDFHQFRKSLRGGKPLTLYLCGQSLNLVLTLAMAWLMFEKLFKGYVDQALLGQ